MGRNRKRTAMQTALAAKAQAKKFYDAFSEGHTSLHEHARSLEQRVVELESELEAARAELAKYTGTEQSPSATNV